MGRRRLVLVISRRLRRRRTPPRPGPTALASKKLTSAGNALQRLVARPTGTTAVGPKGLGGAQIAGARPRAVGSRPRLLDRRRAITSVGAGAAAVGRPVVRPVAAALKWRPAITAVVGRQTVAAPVVVMGVEARGLVVVCRNEIRRIIALGRGAAGTPSPPRPIA